MIGKSLIERSRSVLNDTSVLGDLTFASGKGINAFTLKGNMTVDPAITIDGVDVSAHAADIDAHQAEMFQSAVVGSYMRMPFDTTGTGALVANVLYLVPFFVSRPMTVDRIAIEVTIAGAGGTVARLGIYGEAATAGTPGALLVDGGTVAVDSTGIKAVTVSTALTRGWKFIAVVTDGTPTIRIARPQWTPMGLGASPANVSEGACIYTYTKAAVGIGALADPVVAGIAGVAGGISGQRDVFAVLRIASLD